MKQKRLLTLLTAAGVCLASVPLMPAGTPLTTLTAAAAEETASGTCGENLTWTLDSEGTLTVSGTGAMTDYLSPGETPLAKLEFTEAVLSEGVTRIGSCVFANCGYMTSITIPDSVTSIGDGAFWNCVSLRDVIIPDSVTAIGNSAFHHCSNLTTITIPPSVNTIGDALFSECYDLTIRGFTNSKIEQYAADFRIPFESIGTTEAEVNRICGENLTWDVTDGVLTISGTGAMNNYTVDSHKMPYVNEDFTEAVLSYGVTTVGSYAFEGMNSMTAVTIPESVTSIREGAFRLCSGLTSITIPDSVTNIDDYAFERCRGLTDIMLPDGLTDIRDGTFRVCTSLKSITIPDSVTSIGHSAFSGCTALESITIPKSVTEIGTEAFYDCGKVTVKGYSGSYAEEYAAENGIPFEALSDAPEIPVSGDYNGDKALTVADAVLLARFVSEDTTVTEEEMDKILTAEPDFDGDGLITIRDVVAILKKLGSVQSA